MNLKPRDASSLAGGVLLILFGLMALASQLFRGLSIWADAWPFIIIGVGILFFAGMFLGGKSTSGLAIPGSIISSIGIMLFVQNLTGHFESWAYGWTVIVLAVGLGIFIMGWWGQEPEQRESGLRVMRVGLFLFIIFGAFFEMIFRSPVLADYIFPTGLILLGLYLISKYFGLWSGKRADN